MVCIPFFPLWPLGREARSGLGDPYRGGICLLGVGLRSGFQRGIDPPRIGPDPPLPSNWAGPGCVVG